MGLDVAVVVCGSIISSISKINFKFFRKGLFLQFHQIFISIFAIF